MSLYVIRLKKKQNREKGFKEGLSLIRQHSTKEILKTREEWFIRGKRYYNGHKAQQRALIEKRRNAAGLGHFYVPPEAKVVFAIRLKGINRIPPTPKKILRLFRLRQINNGVFIKVNKATLNMLQRIQPYVAYGYPNRKTVSDLIYKKGAARIGRSRIPLVDNKIVEQHLLKYDILCVEDLIEQVYQCGPNFKEANNFLWTFKLGNPRGGWRNKKKPYQQNGDTGNREELINSLIQRML